MSNFTARTPEELALVTIDADEKMTKDMALNDPLYGNFLCGVGIVGNGLSIETFIKVRVVISRDGIGAHCYIWLFTSAGEPMVRSQFVSARHINEAVSGAFNKLLDGHRDCQFDGDTYVKAIARLYRPDLRACRIA